MWNEILPLCLFWALGLSTEISEVADLCKGLREGDVVAHPRNCESYFVCTTVPLIHFCKEGLHFDAARKACSYPEHANCQRSSGTVTTPTSKTSKRNPSSSIASTATTTDSNWWDQQPKPSFMAIDVETGLITDPMEKYDPTHIECRHYGAFFLPHPTDCQMYFLCAYGHLLQHHCGAGTLWNYKQQACELSLDAECYQSKSFEEVQNSTSISNSTNYLPNTTPTNPPTVCYPIYTSTEGSSWNPTGSGHTELPTPSINTVLPTTKPPSVTGRPSGRPALECPSNHQAYFPHPQNCNKYYICIQGMLVLTSCPRNLYWDQEREYCDTRDKVKCYKFVSGNNNE